MNKKILLLICLLFGFTLSLKAQKLQFPLNDSGSHYIQLQAFNQVWVRYVQNNPNSTIFGEPIDNSFDIGLRRTRFKITGQLTDQVFFYLHFGQNNFTFRSNRGASLFVHDARAEYHVHPTKLHLGGGLSIWNGLSRYSSPSVTKSLGLDIPIVALANLGVSNEFVRHLGIYANGELDKLAYRVMLVKPLSPFQSNAVNVNISTTSDYNPISQTLQLHAYTKYQFLEKENNKLAYHAGTYIGTKKVLNVGAGLIAQPDGMWHLSPNDDTVKTNLTHWAIDVFYDHPLNAEKGTALTAYLAYINYNFGPNYLRSIGIMNPTNGVTLNNTTINGTGNSYPRFGTGQVIYGQFGYLLPKKTLTNTNNRLQPYAQILLGDYEALDELLVAYHLGINWFIKGHNAKISLDYENWPVYSPSNGLLQVTDRRGGITLQYQIAI